MHRKCALITNNIMEVVAFCWWVISTCKTGTGKNLNGTKIGKICQIH